MRELKARIDFNEKNVNVVLSKGKNKTTPEELERSVKADKEELQRLMEEMNKATLAKKKFEEDADDLSYQALRSRNVALAVFKPSTEGRKSSSPERGSKSPGRVSSQRPETSHEPTAPGLFCRHSENISERGASPGRRSISPGRVSPMAPGLSRRKNQNISERESPRASTKQMDVRAISPRRGSTSPGRKSKSPGRQSGKASLEIRRAFSHLDQQDSDSEPSDELGLFSRLKLHKKLDDSA